ncbi:MAG: hypothetical protein KAJ19_13185 [Gammaproteobacteria bacterium]|nr:hypothetical protein [Gammaproteobacteria bacterium]
MTYFVISNSDGDTYIQQMTEDELLEELNPAEHGDALFDFSKALTGLPNMDTNYWGGKFLIIRGEIVVPQAKQVATQIII